MSINFSGEYTAVTITSGQSNSSSASLGGGVAVGLELPAVTAATFTIQKLAHDGSTWLTIYDDSGSAYTITATDSSYVALNPTLMCGCSDIRLVGNTTESSTVVIGIISRGV